MQPLGCFRRKPCIDSQVWPRNQESMQPWVSGALQAKPFFFATTKNRIGRGPRRCCYDHCRRNHSSLPLRKLESVAEVRCRDGRCRRAIPHCCDDGAAVIPKLTPSNQESLQCKMRFQAKSCIDSQVWPRNQESMHAGRRFRGKPCTFLI